MYIVVRDFIDLKNNNHFYHTGDVYPISGYKPSKARLDELLKGMNKYGEVFIELVKSESSSHISKE